MFVEARFNLIRKNLSPKNHEVWDRFDYGRIVTMVFKAVEDGMIF